MKYEMVYFDLDNTLLDFNKSQREALKRSMKRYGLIVDEKMQELYEKINEKWWSYFAQGKYEKDYIVVTRFKEFFEAAGIKNADPKKTSKEYLDELSKLAFFMPGAEKALKYLKQKGQRMAVITNGVERVQQGRSKKVNLDRFIEFVLTSERVGKPKPEPEIFFEASKRSGVPLEKSIYIGDNPDSDLQGAQRAGIDFILFDSDDKAIELDCTIAKNFDEVIRFLE
ncbi:MAG: noncanonical pyrimidine nucleotidase, YjjG family [Kosmotoga sp.]|nr:MAG: noncanonical pyrimidine nucleotidase, YjjG family [Kosmotoga sp.]